MAIFFLVTRSNDCLLYLSQPHFEASVRMRLTLPKVGTWSPPGLSQLQRSITEVKTPCLEVLFILLERPWNVDVENGLEVWAESYELPKSRESGVQTGTISGHLLASPRNKSHLDAGVADQRKEYYMGEGGGFPRVRTVVSQVNLNCLWLVPTPRVFPKVN